MSAGDRAVVLRMLQQHRGPYTSEELEKKLLLQGTHVTAQGVTAALTALVKSAHVEQKWVQAIAQKVYWFAPPAGSAAATPRRPPRPGQHTPFRSPAMGGGTRIHKPFSTPRASQGSGGGGSHPATPHATPLTAKRRPTALSQQQEEENLDRLRADIAKLEAEVKELEEDYDAEELDTHIDQLHKYNDLKDIAQTLIGVLAQQQGKTTKEMYPDFGLDLED